MKILVCVSVVPDTTTKITFTDNNTKFNTSGVQFIINPYDELALTKALELTEAQGGTVEIIHVGPAESEASIRKALAIGAESATRIDAVAQDAQFVAEQIFQVAKQNNYDLIFTGRESIDYNGGQVCGLLGELLGIASVNVINKIEVAGNVATIERDIDGGRETVSVALPAVVSAQKDLCEPRIPNMRGIMAARTKPLNVVAAVQTASASQYQSYEQPAAKQGVKMIGIDQIEELIKTLRNESKVI